jgi:serine/threonine-protein kinase
MKKSNKPGAGSDAPQAPDGPVTPGSLAALAGLGFAASLLAAFLWAELVVSRAGGASFCGPGASDCAGLWNGAFASGVHRRTGLPVAGWGLVWGAVAAVLPLLALLAQARGHRTPAMHTAIRMTAAAGAATIAVLLAVVAGERVFCLGCAATYLLVAGYAGIALAGWPRVGWPEAGRGLAFAAVATGAAFVLLLYPGLHTPKAAGDAGRAAMARAAAPPAMPAGAGDTPADRQLVELIAALAPPLKQRLADSLAIYRAAAPQRGPEPRALRGPPRAPVRITEFTDVLCEHCADLHATLAALDQHVAPGSYSVDSRQFPLDGACNPSLPRRPAESERCIAAKARICLETNPGSGEYAGALFENQQGLTTARVYALAAPYIPRKELEACVGSAATQARLEEDVSFASRFDSDGTPIVAVNGRKGTSFGPFLLAMVLTGGNAGHPAFDGLPPGNPTAHIH